MALNHEVNGSPVEVKHLNIQGQDVDYTQSGTGSITVSAQNATLNSVTLDGACEQRDLPAGYTQVDGVTNIDINQVTGRIDTGIVADVNDIEYDVVAKVNNNDSASWYLLQSRTDPSGYIRGISGSQTGNTIIGAFCGTNVVATGMERQEGHTYHVNLKCKNGNMTLFVEDLTDNTNVTSTGTYTFVVTTASTGLFSNFQTGTTGLQTLTTQNTYVLTAYIKKSGVKVMDYVSCKDSNYTAGFYDKATSTFKGATAGGLQAGSDTVPSPDTPMDIVCNNGVVKWDSVNQAIYTDGTTETVAVHGKNYFDKSQEPTQIYVTASAQRYGYSIPVKAGTYTVSGSTSANIYCKQYTNDVYGTALTFNVTAQTITFAQDGYILIYSSTSSAFDGQTSIQVEQGLTATTYEPYFNGGTATAQRLLKVGTYKDTQELIAGSVTRNVGIKVLDGTENWVKGESSFYIDNLFQYNAGTPICTHYLGVSSSSSTANSNTIRLFVSGNTYRINIFAIMTDYADATAFKTFLATQYANGTPVIIVYPLATPTTETVTGQTLTMQNGTNTIEITQASIANLPLAIDYTARGTKAVNYVVKDGKLVFADSKLYLKGPVNYEVVGSPTITDGVASGLSNGANYITIPQPPSVINSFEMVVRANFGSGGQGHCVYAYPTGYYQYGGFYIRNVISSGSTVAPAWRYKALQTSSETVKILECPIGSGLSDLATQLVYNKVTMETVAESDYLYSYYQSLDGTTWTLLANKHDTYRMSGDDIGVITMCYNKNYGTGNTTFVTRTIDLNNTYIKVNGALWFYGKNSASANIAPVPSGYTYGTTTTSAIGFVDMRTQAFTAAPTGATLGKDE